MVFRILGGKFRSRVLRSPVGPQTRPTTSLVRKAVFDMMQATVEGSRFLDLFAGSGAMGLEAISRGAAHATFVESHRAAKIALQHNIETLGVKNQTMFHFCDVFDFLTQLCKKHATFDLIYADPPYPSSWMYKKLLVLLDTLHWLPENALLLVETPQSFEPPLLQHLVWFKKRSFGSSCVHQYRPSTPQKPPFIETR